MLPGDMRRHVQRRELLRASVCILLATLLWSGNFIVGRHIHGTMTPVALTFWRHALAICVILPVSGAALWRHRSNIAANWFLFLMLASSGIFLFNACTYTALETIPAVNAVMILALGPLAIVLLARVFGVCRLTRWQMTGVLISLTGVGVVVTRAQWTVLATMTFARGDLWMAGGALAFAVHSALLRRVPSTIPSFAIYSMTVSIAVVAMTPFCIGDAVRELAQAPAGVIVPILYLAVGPSVIAYVCWIHAIRVLGPQRVGNCLSLVPLFGALLGVLLLSETVTASLAWGGLLVFAGILCSLFGASFLRGLVLTEALVHRRRKGLVPSVWLPSLPDEDSRRTRRVASPT